MKTINENSTGAEFIQDLNDNFSECVTGGSGNGSVSVNIPLQGGDLKTSTGYVDGRWCTGTSSYTWTDDDFYKYLHTPCYLSLKGNAVKSVTTPSGSTLSIFCYDDTFTLLSSNGVVNAVGNIPTTAKYVKFQLYNSSGYAQVQALAVTLASTPEWVKNTGTAYTPQFFNFECKPPKIWNDANYTTLHQMPTDATVDADNTRYHDNGCVILPPNYSATGKPCKVVFWFNGDGCAWFIRHTPYEDYSGGTTVYEANFKFFAASGYAVVMCSGYSSMWSGEASATDPSLWCSKISPAYIASARAFYDHIMANYNFEPEVYLAAKSAGGGMLMFTAITRYIPVRAAAGISIAICLADAARHIYNPTQKTWQKRLGCPDWDEFVLSASGSGASATLAHKGSGATSNQLADAQLIESNADLYRSFDAFALGSDIDYEDFVEQVLLLTNPYNNGANYPSSLTDIVFAANKSVKTPIKFWCATKDPATPYTFHKIMSEWINKKGGIAELRTYSESDGNHQTLCGGNAEGGKTSSAVTPYGGTRTGVNIGIIEAVEWFKRW